MPIPPRRPKRRRRPVVPNVRPVSNWGRGLVEYPESGLVPEDGLVEATNVMMSYDGSVVDRPYTEQMRPNNRQLIPAFNLKEFVFNGQPFLLTFHFLGVLVSTDEPFTADGGSLDEYDGLYGQWYWLYEYTQSLRDDVSAAVGVRERYDDALLFGDQLIIYSSGGSLPFFYLNLRDDGPATITRPDEINRPSLSIGDPVVPSSFVVDADTENIETYYLRIAYENNAGQLTEASDPKIIELNKPLSFMQTDRIEIILFPSPQVPNPHVRKAHLFLGARAGQAVHIKEVDFNNEDETLVRFNANDIIQADFSAPTSNGTAPLNIRQLEYINGRMVAVVGNNEIYYSRQGAEGFAQILDFSETLGSGKFRVGPDHEQIVRITASSSDEVRESLIIFTAIGQDTAEISGVNLQGYHGGKVYTAQEKVIQTSEYTSFYYSVNDIEGVKSTIAPHSVVNYNGRVYYLADDGFRVIGPQPTLQRLISSNEISQTIRGTTERILRTAQILIPHITGAYFKHRIYWSIPSEYTEHQFELLVLDLQREQGAWTKWTVDANLLLPGVDPIEGHDVLMFGRGRVRYSAATPVSIGEVQKFSDAFNANCFNHPTRIQSGRIRLQRDQAYLSFCQTVHFYLYNVRGAVNIRVYASNEEHPSLKLVSTELVELPVLQERHNPSFNQLFNYGPVSHTTDVIIQADLIVKSYRVTAEVNDTAEWIEFIIDTPETRPGEIVAIGANEPNTYSLGSIEIASIPIYPVVVAGADIGEAV